jgi:PAS domain-containing protein
VGLVDGLKVGERGAALVVDKQGNLLAYHDTARVLKGENLSSLETVTDFINNSSSVLPSQACTYRGIAGTTARRLAVPLVNLMETATRISGGELELEAEVSGPLEVVRLARAFNSMTAKLRQTLAGLEQRISERTRQLQEALGFQEQIVAASSTGIAAYDSTGRCVLANQAAARMIDATVEQVLTQNYHEIPCAHPLFPLPSPGDGSFARAASTLSTIGISVERPRSGGLGAPAPTSRAGRVLIIFHVTIKTHRRLWHDCCFLSSWEIGA